MLSNINTNFNSDDSILLRYYCIGFQFFNLNPKKLKLNYFYAFTSIIYLWVSNFLLQTQFLLQCFAAISILVFGL